MCALKENKRNKHHNNILGSFSPSLTWSSSSFFLFVFLLGEPCVSVSFSLLGCCGGWSDRSFLRFSLLKNLGVGVAESRRVLRELLLLIENEGGSAAALELLWANSALSLSFSFLFDRTILLSQTLDRHSHKTKERVLGKTQTNDAVHSEGITNKVFLLLGFEKPLRHVLRPLAKPFHFWAQSSTCFFWKYLSPYISQIW